MAKTVSLFLWFAIFGSQAVWFWFSAAAAADPPRLSSGDLEVLVGIRRSLRDLPGSDFFSSWRFDSPSAAADACSSFAGVVCSPADGSETLRVTSLTLGSGAAGSPGLAGTLPASLAKLSLLSQLVLSPGRVSGPIPEALGGAAALSELRLLSFAGNLLSGPIPASFAAPGAFPKLHTLDLSHNQLSGGLPGGLLALPSLRVLIVAANGGLTGELPPVAAPLLHLDLRENNFSGPLPRPLPPTLRYLSVSGNAMSGPLEALAASFPDLAFLDLSMNGFSGPIPAAVFDPRRSPEDEVPPPLAVVLLQRNKLSGPIPVPADPGAVAQWTLDMSHNQLTGPLPGVLAAAGSLFVNSNRLTGAVPPELVRSLYAGGMTTFYAQHNYLSGVDFPLPIGGGDVGGVGGAAVAPPLPEGVTICLSFNCMAQMPMGSSGCPAGSDGSRPAYQCPAFNNGTATVVTGGAEDLTWDDTEP